jgi:RNA polymerase sigma factor (sigma-70 family)
LQRSEAAETLRKAVNGLGEPEREIMIRRFYMEQKPSQIAKAMGIPVRKVGNIIYRTKGRLREELKGYYE